MFRRDERHLLPLIKVAVRATDLLRVAQGLKRSGKLVRAASPRGREMAAMYPGSRKTLYYMPPRKGPPISGVVHQPKGGSYSQTGRYMPKNSSNEAKRLKNLTGLRHEASEMAVMRKHPRFTPRSVHMFHGHGSPTPMLNDMNIVAGLKGPGSKEVRYGIRNMRKGELDLLGRAVYPKANRARLDPRRLVSPKKHREQRAAFDTMQQLGLPGNRLSRHKIKEIGRLYESAAKKNTYAARRGTDPRFSQYTDTDLFLRGAVDKVRRHGQNAGLALGGVSGAGGIIYETRRPVQSEVWNSAPSFMRRFMLPPTTKSPPVKLESLRKPPTKKRAWGLR